MKRLIATLTSSDVRNLTSPGVTPSYAAAYRIWGSITLLGLVHRILGFSGRIRNLQDFRPVFRDFRDFEDLKYSNPKGKFLNEDPHFFRDILIFYEDIHILKWGSSFFHRDPHFQF